MSSRVTLAAALALLAAAGIVLLVRFERKGGPVAAGSTANEVLADRLEELARSQEGVTAALERLEALLSERLAEPSVPSAREPVAGGPDLPSFEELIASLDALRATFETESRQTQDLIRSAPAFGGESLQEVRRRNATPNWTALAVLEEDWRTDPRQADRSQYFHTARDLMEAYGPPTAIYRPQGGMLFVYRRHAEGEAGVAWYFRFQDGIVVEFFLEDEEAEDAQRNPGR